MGGNTGFRHSHQKQEQKPESHEQVQKAGHNDQGPAETNNNPVCGSEWVSKAKGTEPASQALEAQKNPSPLWQLKQTCITQIRYAWSELG